MADPRDPEPLLRLLLAPVRAGALRTLLDAAGSADNALAAGPGLWRQHGVDAQACAAIRTPDAATLERCLRWLQTSGHALLGWDDSGYPPLLREIQAPPAALFVAGDPALLWRPAVAIVGSRAATAGGRANAAQFARRLAGAGLCVVSGLAAGIDASAHAATLEAGGATVAVLGTGPDIAYPRANRRLMASIADAGAVVSEHPPGTPPLRPHFPGRNRILAGLSLATVVIEAAVRSGALITARLAADAGREVFALPGSIHNPMARGCHRLIRDGAALTESPLDVLDALAPQLGPLAGSLSRALTEVAADQTPDAAEGDAASYKILWDALGHDPTGMDELVRRTGLTAARASSMLLTLELEGRVAVEHGRYCRTAVRARERSGDAGRA